MPEREFTDLAEALATRFAEVDGIAKALPYEPVTASGMPLVTVMFDGFARAGLETPDVSGAPIRDPIGGRTWLVKFVTRLWVQLGTDEEASQHKLQQLTKAVVLALESDKSLGGVADDSAITSGSMEVLRPKTGKALLMVTMPTLIETTEAA